MCANFVALLCATKDLNCCWSSRPKSLRIDVRKYESTYREISFAARRDLENHLWYLSDEAVCLALFSDQLSVTDRVKIFDRITAKPNERKMRGDPTILKEGPCLGEFAIQRTPPPLSCLMNDDSFLLLPLDNGLRIRTTSKKVEREPSSWEWRITCLGAA